LHAKWHVIDAFFRSLFTWHCVYIADCVDSTADRAITAIFTDQVNVGNLVFATNINRSSFKSNSSSLVFVQDEHIALGVITGQ